MAHSMADVTLPNDAMKPSPIVFTSAPPCVFNSRADPLVLAQNVAALRVPEALHHLRVPDDVGEEDGAKRGTNDDINVHPRCAQNATYELGDCRERRFDRFAGGEQPRPFEKHEPGVREHRRESHRLLDFHSVDSPGL